MLASVIKFISSLTRCQVKIIKREIVKRQRQFKNENKNILCIVSNIKSKHNVTLSLIFIVHLGLRVKF